MKATPENTYLKLANREFKLKNYEQASLLYALAIKETPSLEKYLSFNSELARARAKKNKEKGKTRVLNICNNEFIPNPQKKTTTTQQFKHDIESLPAFLDRRYAQGATPGEEPLQHKELVSIIIPSYNNEKFLARAINSAISQGGVNVEILVIDDGSTDASVALARKIAKKFSNIRVIALLRNFGCYYARNIGVSMAQGNYITIIDSDDIVAPNRILCQMNALKKDPQAVACLGQIRRWTNDFKSPLGELKHGENSLLWRADIVDRIGYYDTVRYGGDTEFRLRIQRTYGTDSVIKIPDELYFLRTTEGSLTSSSSESQAYKLVDGSLISSLSKSRKAYVENYTAWQKKNKPIPNSRQTQMQVSFPLLSRSFELGAPNQNASPSLYQRRVGSIASFPPRIESLKSTIESILPQLDELIIYLNNYPEIPDFTSHSKIRVVRSQDAKGDLRDNGKFFDLPPDANAYIFTFDDDLIYPPDYVAQMIHQIEALGRSSVVGLHGVIFPDGEFTRLQQRTVYHFNKELSGHFVDLLGTGTTAWHNSTLRISLSDFQTKGVCDLWFAIAAAKQEVPLFSIPRKKNWLKEYAQFEECLFNEALNRPNHYFDTYLAHVAPTLDKGRIRRRMERHLLQSFDIETILAAGISLQAEEKNSRTSILLRRDLCTLEHIVKSATTPTSDIAFHIVINGWNCRAEVDTCLRSIANQIPGPYSYKVTLVDDGSSDGTYEKLASSTILPNAKLIRIKENTGPAFARHVGITSISDPETVIVLVDMDDALEPNALRIVADRYKQNPACLMTIGNWHDQHGKINPQPFYSPEEIDNQLTRTVDLFNATHLRTFRRKLYDAISDADLVDMDGKWLETCTDVAIMYPLLDQCWSTEIEFISTPIYRYFRQHRSGTLSRFGKPHKVERLAWLKSKTPKHRLNQLST